MNMEIKQISYWHIPIERSQRDKNGEKINDWACVSMLNKPVILFVGGTCGCGKSTVGKMLADKLGAEFLDGDDFHSEESRAKMSSGIPLNDEDRLPWLKKLAAFGAKCKQNSMIRIIACSALKPSYRNILVGLLDPTECRIVILKVARDILIKRLELRQNHFFNKSLLDTQLKTLNLPINLKANQKRDNSLLNTYSSVDEPHLLVIDGAESHESICNTLISEIF